MLATSGAIKSRIIGARHSANTRCLEAVHKLVHQHDAECMDDRPDCQEWIGLWWPTGERMRNVLGKERDVRARMHS